MTNPYPDLVDDLSGLLDHAIRLLNHHDLHTAIGREASDGERAILSRDTRHALDRWTHRTLIEQLLTTSSGYTGDLATGEAVPATGSALHLVRTLDPESPLDQFLTIATPRAHAIGLPHPSEKAGTTHSP